MSIKTLFSRKSFFSKYPTFLPGLLLILIIVLPGLVGQYFVDTSMSKVLAAEPNLPPSREYPLGTQSEGRDLLTVLILGTPTTLLIGLIGGGIGILVGTTLGMISGYAGGKVDTVIQTFVDVGLTIPALAILIMIAASFPVVTPLTMGMVVALTSWMHPTRVTRSQILSFKEREFVKLTKLSGAGTLHIVFLELLPNLLPFIAASFVNSVSSAILASIGLEVLGLGSQQLITLGTTVYFAIFYSAMWRGMWWWWAPPIVILVLLFFGLFLLSMALDEFSNPRLRRL